MANSEVGRICGRLLARSSESIISSSPEPNFQDKYRNPGSAKLSSMNLTSCTQLNQIELS